MRSISPKAFYILALCILLLTSCKKHPSPDISFYYWKTEYKLNQPTKDLLREVPVKSIYLRFFDIRWDDQQAEALPVSPVKFTQRNSIAAITPVIYITNKTFLRIRKTEINTLAANTFRLIEAIAQKQHISYTNIQIDCDWTLKTKEPYFHYLKNLQQLSKKKLEATIRLHQVKYKSLTGVPPVTNGVLMFYNMGKLNADLNIPSSIYNETEAAKYIDYLKTYPIHLNFALPLFSWIVHTRNGKVLGLYNQMLRSDIEGKTEFSPVKNGFKAQKSFFFRGIYVKENDIFKLEETTTELLEAAAAQLSTALPENNKQILIFYELANLDPTEFNAEKLRKISDRF